MPWLIVRLPCGSRSTQRTRWPRSTNAAARLSVVVVLATPPFWLVKAMTLALGVTECVIRTRAGDSFPNRADSCYGAPALPERVGVPGAGYHRVGVLPARASARSGGEQLEPRGERDLGEHQLVAGVGRTRATGTPSPRAARRARATKPVGVARRLQEHERVATVERDRGAVQQYSASKPSASRRAASRSLQRALASGHGGRADAGRARRGARGRAAASSPGLGDGGLGTAAAACRRAAGPRPSAPQLARDQRQHGQRAECSCVV